MHGSNREELLQLVASHGEELPLDQVLLLIAKEEYPEIDTGRYFAALDALSDRALMLAHDTDGLAAALQRAIFIEGGFSGNVENYYDPRNGYINEVIDRRLGIPITLSIIYIEVARRTGTSATGIGFPGHFLVRHEVDGRSILLDPFEKGAVVRRVDCERILKKVTGGGAELEPWMLEPATPRSIVLRVLTNLKHAYMLQRDFARAVRAIDRLLIFDSTRWTDQRDRGLLFVELDCVGAAVRDLESYVAHADAGRDVDLIRRVLPGLRRKMNALN